MQESSRTHGLYPGTRPQSQGPPSATRGDRPEYPLGRGGPGRRCDGRHLLAVLAAAAAWLEGHRGAVDALNVFPVPDGDTGTNMTMTLQAALREAESSPALDEAGVIAERAAYGALMGARGNSGVILSQLLRGYAHALHGHRHCGPAELAAALVAASETAARAVMTPVEGTILTVAAVAARAAEEEAARGGDALAILDAALEAARAAVARTPEQLPILKQAGVVDAGAQGYMLILEGASRHLHGLETRVAGKGEDQEPLHAAGVAHGADYGYCTEFVLLGERLDELAIRDAVAALGDSTLVVGEGGIVRVHVHTDDPGRVLSYAAPLGRLHRIKIESMQEQHERFVERSGEATPPSQPLQAAIEQGQRAPAGASGVVAVAPGPGLAAVFRSLGAGAVVPGGQAMNPSTEEMLRAIDALPQDSILVLPNNDNVLLVAEQARAASAKQVTVVPARTVPQGIAALVAYLPDEDAAGNAAAMESAVHSVRTGEVTVAVRDARIGGLDIRAGDALGLLDGTAVLAGAGRDEVALDLMEIMGAAEAEILTIYYGADVSEGDARALSRRAGERYGHLDVETVSGGQPHYPYIMSLE